MKIPYISVSPTVDAVIEDRFSQVGMQLVAVGSACALEQMLTAHDQCAWLHVIETGCENAASVVQRAALFPEVPILVCAPSQPALHDFARTLALSPPPMAQPILLDCSDAADFKDQLRFGIARNCVSQWSAAVFDAYWPVDAHVPEQFHDELHSLFRQADPCFRPVDRAAACTTLPRKHLEEILSRYGFSSASRVRRAQCALLYQICVGTLGMTPQCAVHRCGARNVRSANRRLCLVFETASAASALVLDSIDAASRATRYVRQSAERTLRISLAMPCRMLQMARMLERAADVDADCAVTLNDGLARKIVAAWAPTVRALCARRFAPGDGLQDAQQEVWDLVLRKLALHQSYDETCSEYRLSICDDRLGEFIAKLARGRIANLLRSRRRTRGRDVCIDLDLLTTAMSPDRVDALESLERAERAQELAAAVATLSPEQAELIRYRFVDGLTARQIARLRGVREQRISERIAASLTHLRARLSAEDDNTLRRHP